MDVREILELYLQHVLFGRASYLNTWRLVHQEDPPIFQPFNNLHPSALTGLAVSQWHRRLYATPHHANRALKVLRAAWSWAARMIPGFTWPNPTLGILLHDTEGRERTMTSTEWDFYVEPSLPEAPIKQRTFFLHIYLMACRPIEARFTRKTELHLDARLWYAHRSKVRKKAWLPIPVRLAGVFQDLLDAGDPESPWLYQGDNPQEPVCETWPREMWRRHRRRHGIPDDLWLYDLRRSCATDLDEAGVTTRTNQLILGHGSLEHTATYIRPRIEILRHALQDHEDTRLGRQCSLFPQFTLNERIPR